MGQGYSRNDLHCEKAPLQGRAGLSPRWGSGRRNVTHHAWCGHPGREVTGPDRPKKFSFVTQEVVFVPVPNLWLLPLTFPSTPTFLRERETPHSAPCFLARRPSRPRERPGSTPSLAGECASSVPCSLGKLSGSRSRWKIHRGCQKGLRMCRRVCVGACRCPPPRPPLTAVTLGHHFSF